MLLIIEESIAESSKISDELNSMEDKIKQSIANLEDFNKKNGLT